MTPNNGYGDRELYRAALAADGFCVSYKMSEIWVSAPARFRETVLADVAHIYGVIESYIQADPCFTGFAPVPDDADAHDTVRRMIAAAAAVGVGPMAAVAGAVCGYAGRRLSRLTPDVLLENGGDVYINSQCSRVVAIFAGSSPLSMKVGLSIPAGEWGVCTSSGTVGPSVSFGHADAAVVISRDVELADAAATQLGNCIKTAEDIPSALERICAAEGVTGALAVVGEAVGAVGDITPVPLA